MRINFSNHFQILADKYADKGALVHIERNRRYSFRQWHLLTNQIVNMMRDSLQMKTGDFFVNLLENDNMTLLHLPTIFKSDFTGAFTNFRDSLSEHQWQISLVAPKVVFVENALLASHYPMLNEMGVTIVCMDPLTAEHKFDGVLYFWDLIAQASTENPNIEIDDRDHIALLRFTGGTTGKGKPATYSVDNWFGQRDSFFALEDNDWTSATRMLHIAPISHGSSLLLLPTFATGGCTLTLNEPDLVRYCQTIEQELITHSLLVPTILYRLLELQEAETLDLSSLQHMFYGAAPMSPAKLKRLQQKFGNIFIQIYGSTEHIAIALSLSKKAHVIENDDDHRLSAAGQITPGIEVIIANDQGDALLQGEIGELYLRSRGTIIGYYQNLEKTAEEFVNGFWKSGDIGYQDEQGFVYIVDRKKDMIISGGFNIYANEVEAAINSHPSVLMSAVVGIPHDDWGEAVHAEIVTQEGMSLDGAEIIQLVKKQLGAHKAPKSIQLVRELPLSSVGKVLRRVVRDKYWQNNKRGIG